MNNSNINYHTSKSFEDTLHLISVRLRIDYENSSKTITKCDLHGSHDVLSYCHQCKKILCTKCEERHENHNTVDKNEIVSERINSIASLIEKFCCIKSDISEVLSQCQRQRNVIYKDQKAAIESIESVFADLHNQIETLKQELLLELSQVVENCLQRLDSNKIELSALHDDVCNITDLVVRDNSAFEYYDLFELEEYTSHKLTNYLTILPLEPLRPNELSIQIKWNANTENVIKLPLAKINCHISPEKLSYLNTVSTSHPKDKKKPYISSICCDRASNVYLCDTSNNKIKVLNKDYTMKNIFMGSGKHKLITPSTILSLPSTVTGISNKPDSLIPAVIISDPESKNVVTFTEGGKGVDLFVTNGYNFSMCLINDLNEVENLQESFLELSPVYTSMDSDSHKDLSVDQPAIVLCTKQDDLYLEFLQVNPVTLKLCKSRPDLTLNFIDSNSSIFPTCIAWNPFSKYIFLLDHKEHKVLIFSAQDGRFIRFYGRFGSSCEELNHPSDIVVDKEGYVLISDLLNSRIHILDSLGNFVKFLFPYTHKKPICRPTAMCFDNEGNLIVCEADGIMKIYTY